MRGDKEDIIRGGDLNLMKNIIDKEGQYYYAPHRNKWGVWKVGKIAPNGAHIDEFIMDFSTKIQAENFVYKMNGWTAKTTDE